MLLSADRDHVTDEYWESALGLCDSLDEKGRAALLRIMRQVSVDTVANMFGILDGSSSGLVGAGRFTLLDDAGSKLNGELQDIFLASEDD
ncbi:MAG: hypothetical protein AAFY56_16165 [Pseudomonadota bacterium]